MVILSFATGTQLFVEPQLVNQASLGLVPDTWSSNQLAYQVAFRYADFNAAAAIAVDLLAIGLVAAVLIVVPHRTVQDGGLMRLAARGLRLVVLAAFAVFFVVPVLWLILAPTKSDAALVTGGPFSFGSLHQVALAWKHLDAFSDHIYRTWIGNSLLYAFSATAIVLATAIPAGYGLAFGTFPGPQGAC